MLTCVPHAAAGWAQVEGAPFQFVTWNRIIGDKKAATCRQGSSHAHDTWASHGVNQSEHYTQQAQNRDAIRERGYLAAPEAQTQYSYPYMHLLCAGMGRGRGSLYLVWLRQRP